MYRIKKECYYFAGTYNAERDHYLTEFECEGYYGSEEILTFETLGAAQLYLEKLGMRKLREQKYTYPGRYDLSPGEYERPEFIIRKIPVRK